MMERRIFEIPVGTMTPKQAMKEIRKFVMFDWDKWLLEERRKKLDKIFKK